MGGRNANRLRNLDDPLLLRRGVGWWQNHRLLLRADLSKPRTHIAANGHGESVRLYRDDPDVPAS